MALILGVARQGARPQEIKEGALEAKLPLDGLRHETIKERSNNLRFGGLDSCVLRNNGPQVRARPSRGVRGMGKANRDPELLRKGLGAQAHCGVESGPGVRNLTIDVGGQLIESIEQTGGGTLPGEQSEL